MSGGSTGYKHEELREVLADCETLFSDLDSTGQVSKLRVDFRAYLRSMHQHLEAVADMLRAIELEDSGDRGPASTEEAYKKATEKQAQVVWPS